MRSGGLILPHLAGKCSVTLTDHGPSDSAEALGIAQADQSICYNFLFPDMSKVPESNVHRLIFNRPDQQKWLDYTMFVNAATGQRRLRESKSVSAMAVARQFARPGD
ncbi:hypothetical protein BD769DRAFT_830737 [Suillus cothurnatus]|nr:hypothetical protein BD769DRAFT_830737 [Suillus cothurnatus]